MARLQLNKSSLARESAQLRTFERFLPSLDLKRQQLLVQRATAEAHVSSLRSEVRELAERVGREVPMLGNDSVDLDGLVTLEAYEVADENMVGTTLPVLSRMEVSVRPYSKLAKPHWVDDVARLLHDMLEAQLQVQIARLRADTLADAVERITQRVNLFEKVLIPGTKANIRKIRTHLNDSETSAVVRAKLAKRKRENWK